MVKMLKEKSQLTYKKKVEHYCTYIEKILIQTNSHKNIEIQT